MQKLIKKLRKKILIVGLIFIMFLSISSTNNVNASNDPCNATMTVKQCTDAIKKKNEELKLTEKIKTEDELDIYAKSIMSDKKELPNWYIQFNMQTFTMPAGSINGDIFSILGNSGLYLAKLVSFVFNIASFFCYYITMYAINFINGDTIQNIIISIGNYVNNDILNINSDSGLGVKIIFVVMIFLLIKSVASNDGKATDLKSFLKYFFTLLFVAIFAIQISRASISVNKVVDSITKPIIASLVNDEKLAQNDIKGSTIEEKIKNITYENIALSQFTFQNFGVAPNKVDREEVKKLMQEKNYADVLAEKGNVYVISEKNKDSIFYYTAISSVLRLTNTIGGCFFQLVLQSYILTFKTISQIIPIFSLLYIARNLNKGIYALTNYFFVIILWSVVAAVVMFVVLIINLVIAFIYNQFFGINYFATLLLSIFMNFSALWMFKNRKMIFQFLKKIVEGNIALTKAALTGQPIVESINANIKDPLNEIKNDLASHFSKDKSQTEVTGEVGLTPDEEPNDLLTTSDIDNDSADVDTNDLVDAEEVENQQNENELEQDNSNSDNNDLEDTLTEDNKDIEDALNEDDLLADEYTADNELSNDYVDPTDLTDEEEIKNEVSDL